MSLKLPIGLFALATLLLVALAIRAVDSERARVEQSARAELKAHLDDAASRIAGARARLERDLVDPQREADVALVVGGRFVRPAEPRTFPPLRPVAGRDAEGDFYRRTAEDAETSGDLERARGLYRAAAGKDRDPLLRASALAALVALERRRNAAGETLAGLESEFLAAVPADARSTREALLVRALHRPLDDAIEGDLMAGIGGPDEALALGLLAAADLATPDRIARRQAELERVAFLRRALSDAGRGSARFAAGRLVVWRADSDGTRALEGDLPALPGDVESAADPTPGPSGVEEGLVVPGFLEPLRLHATRGESEIDRAARRQIPWLVGGIAALLCGGAAALWLSLRAVAREVAAARAQREFVTRVGHDLRTPLAVIRMYAETLAAGRASGEAQVREFAAIAAAEAERLTALVGRVLDFTRAGERATAPAGAIDFSALVRETAEAHRPLLERDGLALRVSVEPDVRGRGDAEAWKGALGNLIDNARLHAAAGREVEIELTPDRLVVRDRGPGIAPGWEAKIFGRFVRGASAPPGGAGLGLSLVKQVADAHGARVVARPREGGGAEFAIDLLRREPRA